MDQSRRRLLALAGTTALAAPLGGCGTLLYPERRGQRNNTAIHFATAAARPRRSTTA